MDSIRDTPAGQFLRLIGLKTSWLSYPEEDVGFQSSPTSVSEEALPVPDEHDPEKTLPSISIRAGTPEDQSSSVTSQEGLAPEERGSSDIILVCFTKDDPDNPRNWSKATKNWIMILITVYTWVVYCTASIVTPAAESTVKRYNVSVEVASLALSIYVVGYGIGPMLFSPISEIPHIGRNPPYLYSFILFVAVSIALAFVDNFAGLIVLRFFQGLFGSPCLASGLASIEDVYDYLEAPYGYIWWTAAMYCGPSFGPLLAAYAIADNWRWPLYEVIILSSIVLIFLPFLPETSPSTILLNRAKRFRTATGNNAYKAPSEINPIPLIQVLQVALSKPLEITVKDPAIAYACVYGSIVYATYYSFFEAFPLVYLGTYQLSLGGMGLIFTSLTVGCVFGLVIYWVYMAYYFIPRARQHHKATGSPVAQEQWLLPGLVGVWPVPVGLLLFAWTARADVHWIVPTMGIAIFAASTFVMFQSIICYIPLSYPKYVASLFAANDLARSLLAAGFVQFSRSMYLNLGIDRGVTLVAGLSIIGIVGMYGLYYYGAFLRARSKFTG